MRGLEGTRGLDEVCLGSLLSEGPSGTFCAFPLRISLPDPFPSQDGGFGHWRPCWGGRVHVRGWGLLAADLLVGFWKEGKGQMGEHIKEGWGGEERAKEMRQRQRQRGVCGVVGWSCLAPSIFGGAGVELVSMVDFVSGYTVGQDGVEGRVPQRNASL